MFAMKAWATFSTVCQGATLPKLRSKVVLIAIH